MYFSLKPTDAFFEQLDEPLKSTLLALRNHLLNFKEDITEKMSYGMPTYYYQGKRICYLWKKKNTNTPYIGFIDGNLIEHPLLLQEKRARMKIFLIDTKKDLPYQTIDELLSLAISIDMN